MAKMGTERPGTMRTNDGSTVTAPGDMPTATGPLNRDTSMDNSEAFNYPVRGSKALNGSIGGMESWEKNVNLDDPGFDAGASWLTKKGTAFGEMAMFNQLPPGMDIDDQVYADIRQMPLKMVTEIGYPGDGAFPVRDIKE